MSAIKRDDVIIVCEDKYRKLTLNEIQIIMQLKHAGIKSYEIARKVSSNTAEVERIMKLYDNPWMIPKAEWDARKDYENPLHSHCSICRHLKYNSDFCFKKKKRIIPHRLAVDGPCRGFDYEIKDFFRRKFEKNGEGA